MKEPLEKPSQSEISKLGEIEFLIEKKRFQEALVEIRHLETIARIKNTPVEHGFLSYLLAVSLHGLDRYDEALSESERAYELLRNTAENDKVGKVHLLRGLIYSDLGNLRKSELEFRDAVADFRRARDKKGISDGYNELARIRFIRGEYKKAVECLTECLAHHDETHQKETRAKVLANLARIHIRMGNYRQADAYLAAATRLYEEIGNKIGVCNGLLSLGYLWFQRRCFGKARECYERALKLIPENTFTRQRAVYDEYVGELELEQRNHTKAEKHFLEAIDIGERIADGSTIVSQSHRLLAQLRIAQERYVEALVCCKKGMKVARSLPERIEIGAIRRVAAQVYSARGDIETARKNFKKSISILEEIGAKPELGKTHLEALKSKVFDRVDRVARFAKSREIFKELGSDYHLGQASFAYSVLLFENGQYDEAAAHVQEAERLFKKSNERDDLGSVLELKGRIRKTLGEVSSLYASSRNDEDLPEIETQDPRVEELRREAIKFKDSDEPILLTGETGTGKDRWAKAIHEASNRHKGPFVKVNCAGIPEHLLESELFGHRKGAFTGACIDREGKFEAANGGTIFLNEIDCLSGPLQAKILDSIEDKEITRLGENRPRKVDIRVITATSKDLREEVDKGNFREDLYQRVNVVELRLPPLRERKHDIIILIRRFLAEFGVKQEASRGLEKSPQFKYLLSYSWPGNIRELWKGVKRVVQVLKPFDRQRFIEELSKWIRARSQRADKNTLKWRTAQRERRETLKTVEACDGDKREAARLLGISLPTLYRKLNGYGRCDSSHF